MCFKKNRIFRELCNELSNPIDGNFYFKSISNDVFTYIYFPNIITEIIVSNSINNLIEKNICHNFVRSYNLTYLNKSSYITMENLDGNINELVNYLGRDLTLEDYTNILTQMLYAIYVMHMIKISHNDIHYKNVMFKKIRSPHINSDPNIDDVLINGKKSSEIPYFEYCIDGVNIKIKNLGYIIKIIDFGLSFQDIFINNKLYYIRPSYILRIQNHKIIEFNRNIDIGNWLYTFLLLKNSNEFILSNHIKLSQDIINFGYQLASAIIPYNLDLYNNTLRPHSISSNALNVQFAKYSVIANILKEKLNYNTFDSSIFNIYVPYSLKQLYSEYLYIPHYYNNLSLNKMLPISNNIYVANYSCKDITLKNNYKISNTQYFTIVKLTSTSKISFKSKCCNINGPTLLDSYNNNKSYVAINGVFFDIKKTMKPIGKYKDDILEKIVDDIPKEYIDFFFAMLFNNINDIKYVKYKDFDENEIKNFKYIFTFAPLIYAKKSLYRFSVEKNKYKDIFNCDPSSKFYTRITENNMYNCSRIEPGELAHADQPNPRSMLIIKENKDVLLVSIEGRDSRGYGMTYNDMENLAIELGADLAIGLDGGRSSHITIKPSGFKHSIITNPTYKEFTNNYQNIYPVGNLLVFSDTN